MNYVESFNLFGTEAKQIPCIKGTGAPTDKTEGAAGCFYMDTDTGEIYKCVSVSEGAYAWEPVGGSAVGKVTESGGVIFGNESNQATGEFAFAAGDSIFRSGAEYLRVDNDPSFPIYVESMDCELANNPEYNAAAGCVVIGLSELESKLGQECVKTTDGGYCLKADVRYNEAVGSGSAAIGMGAVAFSRASKSFGYRTQAGYPPSEEALANRIYYEKRMLVDGSWKWVATNKAEYDTLDEYNRRKVVDGVVPDLDFGSPISHEGSGCFYASGYDGYFVRLESVYIGDSPDTNYREADFTSVYAVPSKASTLALKGTFYNHIDNEYGIPDFIDNGHFIMDFKFISANNEVVGEQSVTVEFGTVSQLVSKEFSRTVDIPADTAKISIGFVSHGMTAYDAGMGRCDQVVGVTFEKALFYFEENVGQGAVAFGADTVALGNHAIAAGWRAIARAGNSLAIGSGDTTEDTPTEASGYGAVAIGKSAKAIGDRSASIGIGTETIGTASVAIGNGAKTSGNYAIAAGTSKAFNTYAIAMGVNCTNESYGSFAVGQDNNVNKLAPDGTATYYGFVANSKNVVRHTTGAAFGYGNRTSGKYQLVAGMYSGDQAGAYFVVGNGVSPEDAARKNAFAVMGNGNILVGGKSVHSGADYAEFFEWVDGNPDAEDRIGLVVALDGEKIRPAMPGDDVLGIVSGTAAVLGDSAAMYWKDKYLTDEFGRTIYDMVEEFIEVPDPETGEMVKESTGFIPQPRLNPSFDPESTYIPRDERKEWDQIGMMGKLYTRDDGSCSAGDYGCPGENGVLTKSDTPTNIRVMKRTSDNIVLVLLK